MGLWSSRQSPIGWQQIEGQIGQMQSDDLLVLSGSGAVLTKASRATNGQGWIESIGVLISETRIGNRLVRWWRARGDKQNVERLNEALVGDLDPGVSARVRNRVMQKRLSNPQPLDQSWCISLVREVKLQKQVEQNARRRGGVDYVEGDFLGALESDIKVRWEQPSPKMGWKQKSGEAQLQMAGASKMQSDREAIVNKAAKMRERADKLCDFLLSVEQPSRALLDFAASKVKEFTSFSEQLKSEENKLGELGNFALREDWENRMAIARVKLQLACERLSLGKESASLPADEREMSLVEFLRPSVGAMAEIKRAAAVANAAWVVAVARAAVDKNSQTETEMLAIEGYNACEGAALLESLLDSASRTDSRLNKIAELSYRELGIRWRQIDQLGDRLLNGSTIRPEWTLVALREMFSKILQRLEQGMTGLSDHQPSGTLQEDRSLPDEFLSSPIKGTMPSPERMVLKFLTELVLEPKQRGWSSPMRWQSRPYEKWIERVSELGHSIERSASGELQKLFEKTLSQHSDEYLRTVRESLNLVLGQRPEAKQWSLIEALDRASGQFATKKEQGLRAFVKWRIESLQNSSPAEKVVKLREILAIAADPQNTDREICVHAARLVKTALQSVRTKMELDGYLSVIAKERKAIDRWFEWHDDSLASVISEQFRVVQIYEKLRELDEAIRLDPGDALAYFNRGLAKGKLGRWEDAIADYDEAIRLHPGDAIDYHNRGVAKANLGRWEPAIADYDEAIRLDPESAIAHYNRGLAKANLGRWEEAIADFDEAIRLDPGNGIAYCNRGLAKANLGRLEEAIADYDEAVRLDPRDGIAYYDRGLARANLGHLEEAMADFEQVLSLKSIAYRNDSIAKAQSEETIAHYDEAIRLDPGDGTAHRNRGLAEANVGLLKEAIADLAEAIRLRSGDAVDYHNRALAEASGKQLV